MVKVFRYLCICVSVVCFMGCSVESLPTTDTYTSSEPPISVDENGDNADACASGRREGQVCFPEAPRATPPELCPSAQWSSDGICAPEAPRLSSWSCPPAWRSVPALMPHDGEEPEVLTKMHDLTICAPPELPESCAPGLVLSLSNGGCVEGVSSTRDMRWLEEGVLRAQAPGYEGRIVYIDPDAVPETGDGSFQNPFVSITTALEASAEGDILALPEAEISEALQIGSAVALVGMGAGKTVLGGCAVEFGRGARLANLSLRNNSGKGLVVQSDAFLSYVRVEEAEGVGILVEAGAALTLDHVTIQGTSLSEESSGALVVAQGHIEADTLVFEGNKGAGLVVEGESTATVRDLIVRGDGFSARGIDARSGARVVVERGLVENCPLSGLAAEGEGTDVELVDVRVRQTGGIRVLNQARLHGERLAVVEGQTQGIFVEGGDVELHDLVVRSTRSNIEERFGQGMMLSAQTLPGSVVLERAIFQNNRDVGIEALGNKGLLTVRDGLILDTQPIEFNQEFGVGLRILYGGRAVAERLIVARAHRIGIAVVTAQRSSTLSVLEGSDISVLDMRTEPGGDQLGIGLIVAEGGEFNVRRGHISGAFWVSVFVIFEGSHVELEDWVIEKTKLNPKTNTGGLGVGANFKGRLTLSRVAIVDNENAGVAVWGGGSLQATDLTVRDTRPSSTELVNGQGILLTGNLDVNLNRVLLSDNHSVGLVTDTMLEARNIEIRNTQPSLCDRVEECSEAFLGTGLLMVGGDLRVEHFIFHNNALAGVQLVRADSFLARNGSVMNNQIGVNLQIPELNVAEAFINVRAFDNDIDFDARELGSVNINKLLESLER